MLVNYPFRKPVIIESKVMLTQKLNWTDGIFMTFTVHLAHDL